MNITSLLFKLARWSADLRSVSQSVKKGSPMPLVRRATNKVIGRNIFSKFTWRGK